MTRDVTLWPDKVYDELNLFHMTMYDDVTMKMAKWMETSRNIIETCNYMS